jgi:protein-disulfide isomerase
MTQPAPATPVSSRLAGAALAVAALAVGVVGGGWWEARQGSPMQRAAVEQVVHDYILDHPEILPQAVEKLRQNETGAQLGSARAALEQVYPGAVLGNPQGTVTLVEFTDYACTYCRRSVSDVNALIAANPDLRVVVRELPILSPASGNAARMALAAAEQGKYAAFHEAMFTRGRPDPETIAAAAADAGLDLARAERVAALPATGAEITRNLQLARQLGFQGTPSWIAGDAILAGAVGQARLAQAVAAARRPAAG